MPSHRPRFITFDAAQTLLEVNWDPGQILLRSLKACEVDCDIQVVIETYMRLVHSRWGDYKQRNLAGDHALAEQWWVEVAQELGRRMDWSADVAERLVDYADEELYRPDGDVFRPFSDALPCLIQLRELGVPCGIISNWDFSLHRILRVHGLDTFFQFVLCSDEVGYQKPDLELFQLAIQHAQVPAEDILHVGDNPLDDVQGADSAGMQALLIDRESNPGPRRVNSLSSIPKLCT